MKAIKKYIIVFFLVLFFGMYCKDTKAISLTKVTNSTVLDPKYSWGPKFIPGVTKVSFFGVTTTKYPKDVNKLSNGTVTAIGNVESVRLTSDNQMGKIGVLYENVGTYNGTVIDLKITVSEWENLQPANTNADSKIGGKNYPTLFFYKKSISMGITSIPGIDRPAYTYTFYNNETKEPISVAGHMTFMDLDGSEVGGNEYFLPITGFKKFYKTNNSYLDVKTTIKTDTRQKIGNFSNNGTSNDDLRGWFTAEFEGSELKFIYSRKSDEVGNTYRDMTKAAPADKRLAYSYIMTSAAVAPFGRTTPSKSVSVDEITGNDSFYYTIDHFVPGEYKDFYYNSYILEDELPDCLCVKSVEITDDSGADRTSWFDINYTSYHAIQISAKNEKIQPATNEKDDFYNNNYKFKINVEKLENYDMNPWYNGTKCIIPNKALINISSSKLDSSKYTNEVNVECNFKVTTFIDNGNITPNIDKISAGSNQTITFTPSKGYYVDRIVIDDVEQEIDKFNKAGDSYEITNISTDHDIKVYTEPIKAVIRIDKQDIETGKITQNGTTFVGAEYGIYIDSQCTELIEKLILDENGYATSSELNFIDIDTYYIKEIKAPIGYNINNDVHTISLYDTDETYKMMSCTITSKESIIKNNIEITKYLNETDSTEKQSLSGVEFTATLNSDTSKKYSAITDENGYCVIKNLPYGTYTVVETVIPDISFNGEFSIDDNESRITEFIQVIDEDRSQREPYKYYINNIPKKMDITVFKEDDQTGIIPQKENTLDGAEYTIYNDSECTNAIETLTIKENKDGTHSATSGEYLVGIYYIKETKAPIGYSLDTNIYTVNQDSKKQNAELSHHSITSKESIIKIEPEDAKVKVLHVVQGTDTSNLEEVENVLYETEEINGKVDDTYVTQNRLEEINNSYKEQYELVTDEVLNKTGKMTANTIYVIYEYRTIPAIVKVNYIEKDSNVMLYEQEILNGLVGNDYVTQDKIKEINSKFENKYELVSEPENKNGTYRKEEQEVTYYYQKKESKIEVNYLEINTNEVLAQKIEQTGRIDDNYTTIDKLDEINATNENKYEFVRVEGNIEGTYTLDKQIITYYYQKKESKIEVNYLEINTNEVLAQKIEQTGKIDDNYTTIDKLDEINTANENKYEFVRVEGNVEGKFTLDKQVITYYYQKKESKIEVNYLELNTNEVLAQKIEQTGRIDDNYTTVDKLDEINAENENKYELAKVEGNTEGKYTLDKQVITYYYQKKEAKIRILHVLEETDVSDPENVIDVLYPTQEISGKIGDNYTTKSKVEEINKNSTIQYELVTDDVPNKEGIMTSNTIYIIYKYRPIPAKVIVHHYENGSTISLNPDEILEGAVGNNYQTSDKLEEINNKNGNKYELVNSNPENKNGVYTKEEQEVTYYYQKKESKIEIRYLEIDTDNELLDKLEKVGRIDSEYSTENKIEEINSKHENEYEFVRVDGNAEGTYTLDKQIITYYYQKKKPQVKESKIEVNYLELNTNKVLAQKIEQTGRIDDNYTTIDKLDEINATNENKYEFVRVEGNTEGKYTSDIQVITYYYQKKESKIEVRYLEIDTDNELLDKVEKIGRIDSEYSTEDKIEEINSKHENEYEFVRVEGNAEGTYTLDKQLITYYYQKKKPQVKESKIEVNYLELNTNKVLAQKIEQTGNVDDNYTTIDKLDEINATNDNKYEFVRVEGNTEGKYTLDIQVVTYYYQKKESKIEVRYLEIDTDNVMLR